MATDAEIMMKTLSCALMIFGLGVRNTMSLRCYFCKSDYASGIEEDELKTEAIPHCGREPYKSLEEHVVICDIYYDNFGMTNPSFREALSSTTRTSNRRKRNRDNDDSTPYGLGNQSSHRQQENQHLNNMNGSRKNESGLGRNNTSANASGRSFLQKDVYPYNLSDTPWGSQQIDERVSPYHCLTILTINSTFPNRVCGLRYFLDCAMLTELTSQPLEPSSFITSCRECRTDLCNGANTEFSITRVSYSSIIPYVLFVVFEFS